jgi:hypothetical protein
MIDDKTSPTRSSGICSAATKPADGGASRPSSGVGGRESIIPRYKINTSSYAFKIKRAREIEKQVSKNHFEMD